MNKMTQTYFFEDDSAIVADGSDFRLVMESQYMNPFTGSVDTADGWYPEDITTLIEVVKDKAGDWVEVTE